MTKRHGLTALRIEPLFEFAPIGTGIWAASQDVANIHHGKPPFLVGPIAISSLAMAFLDALENIARPPEFGVYAGLCHPVFKLQARHPLEVPCVVGHQGQAQRQCMRGDLGVHLANRLPGLSSACSSASPNRISARVMAEMATSCFLSAVNMRFCSTAELLRAK